MVEFLNFFHNELQMQFISRRVLLFNSREFYSHFTQTLEFVIHLKKMVRLTFLDRVVYK